MMVVEKKPLEKNRNLLGQKQRKVSKSNKQICSPAYGNGPPLFPTGFINSFFSKILLQSKRSTYHDLSLQNWILPPTQWSPGFRTSKSSLNPQFLTHQSHCTTPHHHYQAKGRARSPKLKQHRPPAERLLCNSKGKPRLKDQDNERPLKISVGHQLSAARHRLPANLRTMERSQSPQRLGRKVQLGEVGMVTVCPWRAWSTCPTPLLKLSTGPA